MSQLHWILYGGAVGGAFFSLPALLMYAALRVLVPQHVRTSWREFPVTLFITMPFGFLLGGYAGYKMMPLASTDRG